MFASNTALIIIDVFNDFQFQHGDLLLENTRHIVTPILTLKHDFVKRNMPVIYVNDHYGLWQADFSAIITHCQNKANKPIFDALYPNEDDYFLIKPKHSAFYGTALNTLLHQQQITQLVLTGIAGNICVLFTANDAYMREYKLYVPQDTIASASQTDNEYALRMMKDVIKAKINKVDDLLHN